MALEEFTWHARLNATGEEKQRLRINDYGDGYSQVIGDGINSDTESWPLTFTGRQAYITPILAFLKRHRRGRAFAWTPPLGELGLYRYTSSIARQPLGKNLYSVTVTFETAFNP